MTTKQRSAEQSTAKESTKDREAATEANDDRDQQPQSEAELQEFLEQQITQAIEPVLADFRAQMTQAVQQEMEHAFSTGGGDASGGGQPSDGGNIESEVVERRASPTQRDEEPAQQKESSAEGGEDEHGEEQPPAGDRSAQSLPAKLSQRLQPMPSTLVQGLEHKAGDWLQSLVLAGLTRALSEATRAALQKAAEKGLDTLLQRTFDALPDSSNKSELQTQTTRTLHSILRDVFDAVYAEEVQKELQSHGEKAATCLIKRDMDGAADAVKHALQRVGEEIVSVLRRQWQKVLRLMLKLIMAAIDSSLPGDEQERLSDSSEKREKKEAAGKK